MGVDISGTGLANPHPDLRSDLPLARGGEESSQPPFLPPKPSGSTRGSTRASIRRCGGHAGALCDPGFLSVATNGSSSQTHHGPPDQSLRASQAEQHST